MTLRTAILGTGWGTRVQAPAFRTAGLDVVAVWGRTPAKARDAADAAGIPFASDDPGAVLEHPDVDLVSITTPPSTHCEWSIRALEAGKHVLCEKPTALDGDEAERMLEASQEHPGQLSLIDHELRFLPTRKRLRDLVQDGYVGEILHVEATLQLGGRLNPDKGWDWWSSRAEGGGILGAVGSHLSDALRWTLDREVAEVSCHLETLVPRRTDSEGVERVVDADEYAVLHLEFQGGLPGTIQVSAGVDGAKTHRLLIAGTEGSLTLDAQKLVGVRGRSNREDLTVDEPDFPADLRDDEWGRGSLYLARALKQTLVDGDRQALIDAATFEDGLRIQRILDAARASDASRSWQQVSSR